MTPLFDAYDYVCLRLAHWFAYPAVSLCDALVYYTLLRDFTKGKRAIISTPKSLRDREDALIS